jgi:hypothetical protein
VINLTIAAILVSLAVLTGYAVGITRAVKQTVGYKRGVARGYHLRTVETEREINDLRGELTLTEQHFTDYVDEHSHAHTEQTSDEAFQDALEITTGHRDHELRRGAVWN